MDGMYAGFAGAKTGHRGPTFGGHLRLIRLSGYVYRGTAVTGLAGVYLNGDYCSGKISGLFPFSGGGFENRLLLETGLNIASFGEGVDGELYVLDIAGGIYHIRGGGPLSNAQAELRSQYPLQDDIPVANILRSAVHGTPIGAFNALFNI
jgi:hypothetical protein